MTGERPTFVDNRSGNTMAAAIQSFADYSSNKWPLAIATGYFNLGGFQSIADVLEAAPSVRILLGTEPEPPRRREIPLPGEDPPSLRVRRLADETVQSLRIDRDVLPFEAATDELIRRFAAFLERPSVEVRLYRDAFLHGKAFVFGGEAGVLAGSANFTYSGLNQNLELDLGQYDPDRVKPVRAWFDDLWAEAEPFDLRALYLGDQEFDPHTIYLRMLLELYGPELESESGELEGRAGAIRFALFQKLGIERALRILGNHGGVLLADGVGLGKTYMAGGILQHYEHELGQRALVVAPAGLRDAVWETFLHRAGLPTDVISFQELASDLAVGDPPAPGEADSRRPNLQLGVDQYRLIVVDEAHALRNPGTTYYRAMRRLMAAGGVKRHLVLLTATPVNNSLWDLYNQLMLFARHDAAFSSIGIPHLRDHFLQALKLDVQDLAPNHLFPLLDATAVRRTRHHIQKYYQGEVIDTPEGPKTIKFPTPNLRRVEYKADAFAPGFFAEVVDTIDHLWMARYMPDKYRKQPVPYPAQQALAGLLQSQLLKRFESSLGAFRSTLRSLVASHDRFLRILDQGRVPTGESNPEWLRQDLDDDELAEALEQADDLVPIDMFDAAELRTHIEHDREQLLKLLDKAEPITPDKDPKLAALVDLLGLLGQADLPDDRKVVLFSYYADTVIYIKEYLKQLADDPRLSAYADRSSWITGRSAAHEPPPEDRQKTVWHFVPRSSQAPDGTEDKYDLLLSTDVLAEGQNLQQCGHVINFDLPWNPMRLVQRNGRVDRIGSPHDNVYLFCFFPSAELDTLLRLEERLRRKIAQANAAVGTETEVLPNMTAIAREFADDIRDIEAIRNEDVEVIDRKEGELDAFSGEAFREELRRALMDDRLEELRTLPWKAGSGLRKEGKRAVVFAARIGYQPHWRMVPVGEGVLSSDVLAQLDASRCLPTEPRVLPYELRGELYGLWAQARKSILADYERLADPAQRQSGVPLAQRDAVTLLQSVDVPGAVDSILALQVPWPTTVARRLREILRQAEGGLDQISIASQVINLVRQEGLRAPTAEPPLPPITLDDIHLVCYQVVTS